MNKEKIIFRGSPSQIVNFNSFTLCAILFVLILFLPSLVNKYLADLLGNFTNHVMLAIKFLFFVPAIWAFWIWVKVKTHRYTITTERLMEEYGVFSKETNELELYRVKDITFIQPFSLRMFGCGNVVLDTSDKSTPIIVMHAVKDGRKLLDRLRHQVQLMRDRKGVREID